MALPNESIDLVVGSPPYNISRKKKNNDKIYYEDQKTTKDYLQMLEDVFKECFRVLKPDGRMCINFPSVMNTWEDYRQAIFFPEIDSMIRKLGFKPYTSPVIWFKGDELTKEKDIVAKNNNRTAWGSWMSASAPRFRGIYEVILFYYKEEQNKRTKGESDVPRESFLQHTMDLWMINPSKDPIHPYVFPEELVKRCIQLFTYVGDKVLDPFVGSGTTLKVAKELGRSSIGIEYDERYLDRIMEKVGWDEQSFTDYHVKYQIVKTFNVKKNV